MFCDFLTGPDNEWDRVCLQGFGRSPAQIITEFNRARHAQNNEQAPVKRPFTRAELQGFVYLADLEVERVLAAGRKAIDRGNREQSSTNLSLPWGRLICPCLFGLRGLLGPGEEPPRYAAGSPRPMTGRASTGALPEPGKSRPRA